MAKKLYQVQAGETLKSIARDRLADEQRWMELAYINSLDSPYFVTPGQLILLPDDSQPLEIVVTKGQDEKRAGGDSPNFILSPAEWGWFAAGALLLWMLSR